MKTKALKPPLVKPVKSLISERGSFSFKFAPVVILLVFLALGAFVWIVLKRDVGFPLLEKGAYVGKLEIEGKPTTLYVERGETDNKLLVVLFKSRWKPKFVDTKERPSKKVSSLEPVKIEIDRVEYLLRGGGAKGSFSGQVEDMEKEHVGTWVLTRVEREDIFEDVYKKDFPLDFGRWLLTRGRKKRLSRELSELKKEIAEKKDKLAKLTKYVSEEDALRGRAKVRKEALRESLRKLKEEKSEKASEVQKLVSELDLIRRITKRGKAVELARQVSKRENKWYLANWGGGEEDYSRYEEQFANEMKVNLQEVDARYRLAVEVERLRNEIERERARIEVIKEQYAAKVKESLEAQGQANKKSEKSWLRRLFD